MKWILSIAFLLALVWAAGFVYYVQYVRGLEESPEPCEAIVAITGSIGRIERGFELLEEGRAPYLLVSGIGDDRHSDAIIRHFIPSTDARKELEQRGAVTLDRLADSTYGNARETRKWAESQGFERLCLVTANYHMPRSLLVFRRAMPDRQWVPIAIRAPDVKLDELSHSKHVFTVVLREYIKLIAAWVIDRIEHVAPGTINPV